jgi:hypothetical protein
MSNGNKIDSTALEMAEEVAGRGLIASLIVASSGAIATEGDIAINTMRLPLHAWFPSVVASSENIVGMTGRYGLGVMAIGFVGVVSSSAVVGYASKRRWVDFGDSQSDSFED